MSKLPPVITTEVLKKPDQAAGRHQLSTNALCAQGTGMNIALFMTLFAE